MCARAHPFSNLGNGWTHCVEILHVNKAGPGLRKFDCGGKSGHWRTTFTLSSTGAEGGGCAKN